MPINCRKWAFLRGITFLGIWRKLALPVVVPRRPEQVSREVEEPPRRKAYGSVCALVRTVGKRLLAFFRKRQRTRATRLNYNTSWSLFVWSEAISSQVQRQQRLTTCCNVWPRFCLELGFSYVHDPEAQLDAEIERTGR